MLPFLLLVVLQFLLGFALTLLPRYFRQSPSVFKKTHKFLDELPVDIFVDNLSPFLDIQDLLILRRVNKHCYATTRHPTIWKRLLCRSASLPPPLPPSSQYSLASLTALDAERLVIRQTSLKMNLRNHSPRFFANGTVEFIRTVSSISIVPGGKHFVMSSYRNDQNSEYFLEILDLDCIVHGADNLSSLKKIRVKTKPYGLKAMYMVSKGIPGIVVAYIRSELQDDNAPALGLDPSDFSEDHNPFESAKLIHFCRAIHIPLTSLDGTASPITEVATFSSPFQFRAISLNHVLGRPFMAVVRQKKNVVFWDLDERQQFSMLQCQIPPENLCQIVENIVLLPHQDQVLVVCRCPHSPAQNHSIALYNIPSKGLQAQSPGIGGFHLTAGDTSSSINIVISDFHYPSPHDESIHATLARQKPPSPLTIHFRLKKRYTCMSIMPRKMRSSIPSSTASPSNFDNTKYRVSLERDWVRFSHQDNLKDSSQVRIIPASRHPLAHSIADINNPPGPAHQFCIYNLSFLHPTGGEQSSSEDSGGNGISESYLRIPKSLSEQLTDDPDDCLIAWDESIGRACVVTDGSQLDVMDYGYTLKAPLVFIKSLFG